MLVPAILKKYEILDEFKKYYYTNEMMYESGSLGNYLPNIVEEPDESTFQYAVLDNCGKLVGYIGFRIDWYNSNAYNFSMISFDNGRLVMGRELKNILDMLINQYKIHRMEWRMISGNPVEKSYDRFCKKHGGTKHILKDVFKDRYGVYHDDIIYEIILN